MTAIETHRSRAGWGGVLVQILGWLMVILGVALGAGGIWLIILGGTWYYLLAGAGLIATGVLLIQLRISGLWVYLATWIGTAIWAYYEVGTDWWAQVPRLVAPTVLLILVLLCIPALRR